MNNLPSSSWGSSLRRTVLQGINLTAEGTHHGNFPSLLVRLVEERLAHYLRLAKSCTNTLARQGRGSKPPTAGRVFEEPSRRLQRAAELHHVPTRPAKTFTTNLLPGKVQEKGQPAKQSSHGNTRPVPPASRVHRWQVLRPPPGAAPETDSSMKIILKNLSRASFLSDTHTRRDGLGTITSNASHVILMHR